VLLEHTITNPQQRSVKSVLSAHLSVVKDILQTVMSLQPARLRILLALQFVEAAQVASGYVWQCNRRHGLC